MVYKIIITLVAMAAFSSKLEAAARYMGLLAFGRGFFFALWAQILAFVCDQ